MGKVQKMIGKLMMIDDNEVDQMLYKRIVSRSGLVGELVSFLDAEEALDYLRNPGTVAPDLILLDINMPGMDGFAFLDAVTGGFDISFVPVVVMLTTSLDPADAERAQSYEVVRDFQNKPLTREMLAQFCEVVGTPV